MQGSSPGSAPAVVLFVTDKGVRGAGLTRAAEASLAEAADLTVFEDVVADPPAQVVEAAVALAGASS